MLCTLSSNVRRILHARIAGPRLVSASFASSSSKKESTPQSPDKNIKDVREGMSVVCNYSSKVVQMRNGRKMFRRQNRTRNLPDSFQSTATSRQGWSRRGSETGNIKDVALIFRISHFSPSFSAILHRELIPFMAAETTLKIVREILSACNTAEDMDIAAKVPSMVRVLAQNLNHSDRRVRYAAVSAFSAVTKNYQDQLEGAKEFIKEFDQARSNLAENQNDGDLEQLSILNEALSTLGFEAQPVPDNEYLDSCMQPDYVTERVSHNNRLHSMIVSLSASKKGALPSDINPAVVQMRMVLVAGVLSASLRVERNEAAEEDSSENAMIARVMLSVKVSPGDDDFVDDLNAAVLESTDGKFKLANVDYWQSLAGKSGKETPAETMEKSTEFSDYDDTMYLDDDSQLSNRVLGKKGKSKAKKPWSMFNPSSALGLNSVFNSTDLLEMIEYDSEEAVAARESVGSPKVAEEPKAASTGSRFGLLRRLFG